MEWKLKGLFIQVIYFKVHRLENMIGTGMHLEVAG